MEDPIQVGDMTKTEILNVLHTTIVVDCIEDVTISTYYVASAIDYLDRVNSGEKLEPEIIDTMRRLADAIITMGEENPTKVSEEFLTAHYETIINQAGKEVLSIRSSCITRALRRHTEAVTTYRRKVEEPLYSFLKKIVNTVLRLNIK